MTSCAKPSPRHQKSALHCANDNVFDALPSVCARQKPVERPAEKSTRQLKQERQEREIEEARVALERREEQLRQERERKEKEVYCLCCAGGRRTSTTILCFSGKTASAVVSKSKRSWSKRKLSLQQRLRQLLSKQRQLHLLAANKRKISRSRSRHLLRHRHPSRDDRRPSWFALFRLSCRMSHLAQTNATSKPPITKSAAKSTSATPVKAAKPPASPAPTKVGSVIATMMGLSYRPCNGTGPLSRCNGDSSRQH